MRVRKTIFFNNSIHTPKIKMWQLHTTSLIHKGYFDGAPTSNIQIKYAKIISFSQYIHTHIWKCIQEGCICFSVSKEMNARKFRIFMFLCKCMSIVSNTCLSYIWNKKFKEKSCWQTFLYVKTEHLTEALFSTFYYTLLYYILLYNIQRSLKLFFLFDILCKIIWRVFKLIYSFGHFFAKLFQLGVLRLKVWRNFLQSSYSF